jgi:HAD superfamily hydrolase (TIGR01509 family)
MSLRGRQGWIFDLDGTLALPVHDFDGLREALGLPQGVLILEYLASRPAAEAKTLGARLEALEAELIAECRPQPGIRDALEGLRNRGWRLGVVTRNSVANAHLTLAQLGLADLFAPGAVLGRESAEPKPSPDALHQLRREWDLPPERCVMLGDHGLDLAAGRAAGVATVHFTADCSERWPELTDHLLPHWSHLGALL